MEARFISLQHEDGNPGLSLEIVVIWGDSETGLATTTVERQKAEKKVSL
jgi:hypothetical protein